MWQMADGVGEVFSAMAMQTTSCWYLPGWGGGRVDAASFLVQVAAGIAVSVELSAVHNIVHTRA